MGAMDHSPLNRYDATEDMRLVSRIRAGNQQAMSELSTGTARLCMRLRCGYCRMQVGRRMCFRTCFCSCGAIPMPSTPSRGNLAAWLAVISRHRAIDRLRQRRPETDIEDCVIAGGPDIRDETERKLVIDKVRAVVQEMSPGSAHGTRDGILRRPDAYRDCGKDRRTAGYDQDAHSQRSAVFASKVCRVERHWQP